MYINNFFSIAFLTSILIKHYPLKRGGPGPEKKEEQGNDEKVQIGRSSSSTLDEVNTQIAEGTTAAENKDQVVVQVENDQGSSFDVNHRNQK